jgi:hypothetical protein
MRATSESGSGKAAEQAHTSTCHWVAELIYAIRFAILK